jgi:DNA polymerase I-like protein with 3'-5' exonuclease and polymerase domains
MQVHDELVFDVFPWEEEQIKQEVTRIMEWVLLDSPILLPVDAKSWDSWKDTK